MADSSATSPVARCRWRARGLDVSNRGELLADLDVDLGELAATAVAEDAAVAQAVVPTPAIASTGDALGESTGGSAAAAPSRPLPLAAVRIPHVSHALKRGIGSQREPHTRSSSLCWSDTLAPHSLESLESYAQPP